MKTIALLIFLVISLDILSQDLNGYYKSNGYSYVQIFGDSLIEFSVLYGCCNREYHQGNGKYIIYNDSLVVYTSALHNGLISSVKVISELPNKEDIEINVTDGYSNKYIAFPVIIKDKNGIIDSLYIDSSGSCLIKNLEIGTNILLDYIDWGKAQFEADSFIGKKILVDITPIHPVLNDTVYFRVINKDPYTLEGLYYQSGIYNNKEEIINKEPKRSFNRTQEIKMHIPIRIELVKK